MHGNDWSLSVTLKLYQFPPVFGLPNASPFCMKLETYLRMVGLPFETVSVSNPARAPKGKLPYIEHEGQALADSNLILDYLKAKYGDPLDAWLSAEQQAVALAMRRLIEENLYWALLYERWFEPATWRATRDAFFGSLPWPLSAIVPRLARRSIARELWGHGMGRHSPEEIRAIGRKDLTAMADLLDGKPFMMGEKPSTLDAVAYATFANTLGTPGDEPLKGHLRQYPQVIAYCKRMKAKYYG